MILYLHDEMSSRSLHTWHNGLKKEKNLNCYLFSNLILANTYRYLPWLVVILHM